MHVTSYGTPAHPKILSANTFLYMLLHLKFIMHSLLCLHNSTGMSRTAQHDSSGEESNECRQEDFMNDVLAEIPSCWHKFGLCLGIDNEKLRAVEAQNHHDQCKCFAEVYSIWKKEDRRPVTWDVVIEILEGNLVQNKALAHKLRKKHGVS